MQASSVTRRLFGYANVRDWAWWQLPPVLRAYVGAIPVAALAMIGVRGIADRSGPPPTC